MKKNLIIAFSLLLLTIAIIMLSDFYISPDQKSGPVKTDKGKNILSVPKINYSTTTKTKDKKENTNNKQKKATTTKPFKKEKSDDVKQKLTKKEGPKTPTLEELQNKLQNAKNELSYYLESLKENQKKNTSATSSTSFNEINKETREALVNILCTAEGDMFNSASGSGIIIDSNGIILTNAHIAQLFLTKDYPEKDYIDCKIRTGSPAKNTYKADLIYLSQKWLNENKQVITQDNPVGTGEYDYALLKIKSSVKNTELPEKFDYIPLAKSDSNITVGEKMLIAGFPAGFIGGILIQKELYAASTIDKTEKLYTFGEKTLDLLSFGGNIMAQRGASGAAVVNKNKKTSGIVVTSTQEKQTSDRDLRAITIGHINRNLKEETNLTLPLILKGNIEELSEKFRNQIAPVMRSVLIDQLKTN